MNRDRRSWRRRLLPRPWLALWLWIGWLLLNQTLAPAHLVLGLLLALAINALTASGGELPAAGPHADGGAEPRRSLPSRVVVAVRLLLVVVWDIIVANLQVARLILGPQSRLRPAFVRVPLSVTRSRSITLLAGIITMTPGTLSAELSNDHRYLLVHGLDVDDEASVVAQIKSRYEAPIKEMFE